MKDERFPKASLITVRWRGVPSKLGGSRMWWHYARCSNAGLLYAPFLEIAWRMPWLPTAAASKGWDECWRQMYPQIMALEEENKRLKDAQGLQN